MWFEENREPETRRECEARYRMAVSRLKGMAPTLRARAELLGNRAAAELVPSIERRCGQLGVSWSCARGIGQEAPLAMEAERALHYFWEEAMRRNAAEAADDRRAAAEGRFRQIIGAFDRCISEVEKNVPWYEFLGGPLFVTADAYVRRQQTETSRNDRKNLLTKWDAARTDSERAEVLKLAERWYEATRLGLNDCKGIVPSLGESMVAEAKNAAAGVAETVKQAGSFVTEHLRPLAIVALWLGALLVLRH